MADEESIQEVYKAALGRRGFLLLDEIGRGSFGTVYRAEQERLGRKVAIKFFDSSLARRVPQNLKRFEREALLLAKVEHPNIPLVITSGSIAGVPATPYIVMQHISGQCLSERLHSSNTMSLSEAARVAVAVLAALEAVHRNRVVHRDVKPDNIIIGEYSTYLIDFSIGFSRDYSPGLTRATLKGEAIGTADYAAPEQKRGDSNVDHRADLYAVGITLFEMLVGHPRMNLARISQDLGQFPPQVAQIISKACSQDSANRYANARAFMDDLSPFSNDSGVSMQSRVALCPSLLCDLGSLSSSGYFRGPLILHDSTFRHCQSCGTELLRRCQECGAALPDNIASLVVKSSRAGQDVTKAHCGHCGSLLYQTPQCKKCGSYLRREDMAKDTSKQGCQKCRAKGTKWHTADDDIPF